MKTTLERPTPARAEPRPHAPGNWIVPLGRVLYAAIFILAAPSHFAPGTIDYARAYGVPMAGLLVPVSGLIALLGGLSVALGYRARSGGWLLVLFLVPVTFSMHAFWNFLDPQEAMMQRAQFMKNIGLLGAALVFARLGAGPYSLRE